MDKKSYYRADIDGLRAFAVVAVILFHLEIPGWTGGFVGVDVFFVISGYLITSIIVREINGGTFSLLNFWERRVRRIIPPLVVMVSTTLVAAYFIMLYPIDYKGFGLTLVAQSLFLTNMFFMRQSSYFNAPTDTTPLLHMWSVAVEEQFYIFFPLVLLMIFYIAKRHVLSIIIFFATLSFLLNIYLINIEPSQAFTIPLLPHIWGGATNLSTGFYFLPARAWELLLGASIALCNVRISKSAWANFLSIIGFVGLISSFFILHGTTTFPGYIALIPTLSTACIILAHVQNRTFVYNFLSFPVFMWTGLISYSLYLWHWPVIVLSKQVWVEEVPRYWIPLVLGLTITLAFISYRFIETPIRKKYLFPGKKSLFIAAFTSLAALMIIGSYIYSHEGLPERAPQSARAIALAATDSNPRYEECFKNNIRQIKILSGGDPCFLGDAEREELDFILWGDSQADSMMPVFDEIALQKRIRGAFFAIGGCAPIVYSSVISDDDICTQVKNVALEYIIENDIKTIILVADWLDTFVTYPEEMVVTLEEGLKTSIKSMPTDTRIYIVQTVPRNPNYNVRSDFYRSIQQPHIQAPILNETHRASTKIEREALLSTALENENVTILDPADIFCASGTVCMFDMNGKILYKDESHINTYGSKMLKPLFTSIFNDLEIPH